MCKEMDSRAAQFLSDAVSGSRRSVVLTPEVRTQLQICVNSVEQLASMQLPAEAHVCLVRLNRAIDNLVQAATTAAR